MLLVRISNKTLLIRVIKMLTLKNYKFKFKKVKMNVVIKSNDKYITHSFGKERRN